MKLKGSEIICESLLREGVEVLFGHPGGAILPFYDALWSYPQLRHVLVRHEQSAAHRRRRVRSGNGQARRLRRHVRAGSHQSGYRHYGRQGRQCAYGRHHRAGGAGGAGHGSLPGMRYLQHRVGLHQAHLPGAVRRRFAPHHPRRFSSRAGGTSGPRANRRASDVQLEEVEFEYPEIAAAPEPALSREVMENVRKAATLMNEAERPVIVAGHGIVHSGAFEELRALAEASGIPVINTLLGLSGFPRNHPQSLGMLGMHGMYWCNMVVDQADVLIGLGMRFDDRVTGRVSGFAPHARVIHLDIEASQVGRIVPAEVPLVGDAKPILKALLPLAQWAERPEWMAYIAQLKAEHPSLNIPQSDSLLAQQVLAQMNDVIQESEDAVVVTGVGQHQMWAAQYLFLNQPNSFVTSGGLGVMGFEVPAALGAQMGRPGATVWSVAGDGGFQMTLQELVTAVQERLPIKIALFNNGYLGMVRQWQEMFFDGHIKEVPMPGPDYVSSPTPTTSRPCAWNIRKTWPTLCGRPRSTMGPFLIEFVVEQETNVFPMVPPGGSLADTMEDPRTALAALPG